jgi:hypothetical protein
VPLACDVKRDPILFVVSKGRLFNLSYSPERHPARADLRGIADIPASHKRQPQYKVEKDCSVPRSENLPDLSNRITPPK